MTQKGTLVFIRSIPRETASRIEDWTNDSSGKKMKKTKIGRCTDTVQALYKPSLGGLANGLSYKPWLESGAQKKDENGKPLTLQDREEQRWGLPAGYLTNKAWRRGNSSNPEELTYFQKVTFRLKDGTTVLDLNNFDDAMFYHVAQDSKYIANSEQDYKLGKWPKASHYIALENESEEIKYRRNEVRSQAFAKLHSSKMSSLIKRDFITVLGLAKATAVLTEEQVHNVLFDYIDRSSFTDGSNIDKFNEVFNLLSSAQGKLEFQARILLKKGIDTRVLYEKQGAYMWTRPSGTIDLGQTFSEAVDFLLSPKKDALVEELKEEIKLKS